MQTIVGIPRRDWGFVVLPINETSPCNISDAGPTRPGWMPPQIQVCKHEIHIRLQLKEYHLSVPIVKCCLRKNMLWGWLTRPHQPAEGMLHIPLPYPSAKWSLKRKLCRPTVAVGCLADWSTVGALRKNVCVPLTWFLASAWKYEDTVCVFPLKYKYSQQWDGK